VQRFPKQINSLGDHIRARRLNLKLLQKQVSDQIGVREQTITGWERNVTRPRIVRSRVKLNLNKRAPSHTGFGALTTLPRSHLLMHPPDTSEAIRPQFLRGTTVSYPAIRFAVTERPPSMGPSVLLVGITEDAAPERVHC
jgi:DNA-binding XRE family transcriptional regulator